MATLSCVDSANGKQVTRETEATCPACGQGAALIPLGARVDHPHRWRPWVVVVTELALCERCGAVAATALPNVSHLPARRPLTRAA